MEGGLRAMSTFFPSPRSWRSWPPQLTPRKNCKSLQSPYSKYPLCRENPAMRREKQTQGAASFLENFIQNDCTSKILIHSLRRYVAVLTHKVQELAPFREQKKKKKMLHQAQAFRGSPAPFDLRRLAASWGHLHPNGAREGVRESSFSSSR